VNVDAVVSDKKKTTMLDLAGSPSFNYEAAAVSLNTANATRVSKNTQANIVELDRVGKIQKALQRFSLATAGASIASPLTAPITETAGGIADFIDGTLYLLDREYGNASLSYASILPVMGQLIASRKALKAMKDNNVEYYTFYRAVGDDVAEELFTGKAPNAAFYRSGGVVQKGELVHIGPKKGDDFLGVPEIRESFMEVFGLRNPEIVGEGFRYPKVFTEGGQRIESYPMGSSHLWTTNSFESALDFAKREPNFDDTATILRFDIPIEDLKKMSDIGPDTRMFGPGLISNDMFLYKQHNIGTGISGSSEGIMGVRGAYDPPHGASYTIFQDGIPNRYFTGAIKGTQEQLLKQREKFIQDASDRFAKIRDEVMIK
tara:strand:+ start:721 stop:1845 length:1125 start_codon:yes stop_codon:yes gene_type:complete